MTYKQWGDIWSGWANVTISIPWFWCSYFSHLFLFLAWCRLSCFLKIYKPMGKMQITRVTSLWGTEPNITYYFCCCCCFYVWPVAPTGFLDRSASWPHPMQASVYLVVPSWSSDAICQNSSLIILVLRWVLVDGWFSGQHVVRLVMIKYCQLLGMGKTRTWLIQATVATLSSHSHCFSDRRSLAAAEFVTLSLKKTICRTNQICS